MEEDIGAEAVREPLIVICPRAGHEGTDDILGEMSAFRDFFHDPRDPVKNGIGHFNFLSAQLSIEDDPVNTVFFPVELIITQFMDNKQGDNHAADHSHREPYDVNDDMGFLPAKRPETLFQEVFEHGGLN